MTNTTLPNAIRVTSYVKVSLATEKPAAEVIKEKKEILVFEVEMERVRQALQFMSHFRSFLEGSLENLRKPSI